MVKISEQFELEQGDALVIFSRGSKRKVGEGIFEFIGIAIEASLEKGPFHNGTFVNYLCIRHPDNTSHIYSFEDYRFRLKNQNLVKAP